MDRVPIKAFAEKRSRLYWLLSSFYLRKPDKAFLEELKSKISGIGGGIGGELEEAVEMLKDTLENSKVEELSQRLVVEFTRLFRGIKKGYGPPPPYESVYRGEGRVVGEVTLEVMKIYSEAGFGIIDEYAGPQDHIGAELKFMSFLCYREMEAWENEKVKDGKRCLEMEKKFLDEHLLQLIPEFCGRVEEEAKEEFYVGVARLTERFVLMDAENIEIMLKGITT
ncbi:MAG: molecular chaperone [Candidatus Geothermarchaeales archaeon]